MIVTVRAMARHLCPYHDEVDVGTVELRFDVDDEEGDAPELHGVSAILYRLSDAKISHEDFTRQVLDATSADRVISDWTTAGLAVTCDLSRESLRT